MIDLVPWTEYAEAMTHMWGGCARDIPIINNPYGVIHLPLPLWPTHMLYKCCRYSEDGVVLGYVSFYNISLDVVRVRGIYIDAQHRGHGAGHRMVGEGLRACFPPMFYRMIGFYKWAGVERFIKHGGMTKTPDIPPIWSEFSQTSLTVLHYDQGTRPDDLSENQAFIDSEINTFGLGGTMNLNTTWGDEEWLSWATPHATSYPDLDLKNRVGIGPHQYPCDGES